jgi:putative intracellular protease/amidase
VPVLTTPAEGFPVSSVVGVLAFGAGIVPFLRGWVAGQLLTVRLDTRLAERELRGIFLASVCRGSWSLADDGPLLVARSAAADPVGARSADREIGLRIVDSGGWRVAWIGTLRSPTGPRRLTDATATLRPVGAFVTEVFRSDPGAVRGRWAGR